MVELSKLMRYVLYETSNKTILLSREIQFLDNYIELMKLRYINKVGIEVSLPHEVPEVHIPPLLFISFIENAFKHGVSYRKDSFIHISMELDGDKLLSDVATVIGGKKVDSITVSVFRIFVNVSGYFLETIIHFLLMRRTTRFSVLLIIPLL